MTNNTKELEDEGKMHIVQRPRALGKRTEMMSVFMAACDANKSMVIKHPNGDIATPKHLKQLVERAVLEAKIDFIKRVLELPNTNGGCDESHVEAKFTSWFESELERLTQQRGL